MAEESCLVLYGDSVFLAGIKTEFQRRELPKVITVEAERPDAPGRIRALNARAVLFDLAAAQPDFAISLLREQPGLLLIGLDPSSDDLLVLCSRPARALSMSDLVEVITRGESVLNHSNGERNENNHPSSLQRC
jgi:hypothetical protein